GRPMCGSARRFSGGGPDTDRPDKRKAPTRGWGAESVGAFCAWPHRLHTKLGVQTTNLESGSWENEKFFGLAQLYFYRIENAEDSSLADHDPGAWTDFFQQPQQPRSRHRH